MRPFGSSDFLGLIEQESWRIPRLPVGRQPQIAFRRGWILLYIDGNAFYYIETIFNILKNARHDIPCLSDGIGAVS